MKSETTVSMTIEFDNKELAQALSLYAKEKISTRFGKFESLGIEPKLKAVCREGEDSAYLEVTIIDTDFS
jgi:hypothetical protein